MSVWDDLEDARSGLAAALAFLDDVGDASQGDGDYDMLMEDDAIVLEDALLSADPEAPLEGAPLVQPKAHARAQPARHSKCATLSYRNRRKEELECLREQAQELEQQLQLLQDLAAVKREACNSTSSEGEDGDDDAAMRREECHALAVVWKDLAARQRNERHRAEVENARLRRMLLAQARVVDHLERLLKRQPQNACIGAQVVIPRRGSRFADSGAVFAHLLAFTPSLLAQVDAVFSDPRLDTLHERVLEAHVRKDAEQDLATMDVMGARVVPFDQELTADVLWEFLCKPPFPEPEAVSRDVECTQDTLKKEVHHCGTKEDGPMEFIGRVVAQRFVQQDRIVIVAASIMDPIVHAGKPMDGFVMRGMDWMVVEKPRSVVFPRHVAQTHMRRLTTPILFDDSPRCRSDAEEMIQHMTQFASTHLEQGGQLIDNMLLQASLKKRRHC